MGKVDKCWRPIGGKETGAPEFSYSRGNLKLIPFTHNFVLLTIKPYFLAPQVL